jgi:hypothetical protein
MSTNKESFLKNQVDEQKNLYMGLGRYDTVWY